MKCPMQQSFLWAIGATGPRPVIDILTIGEDGYCQCTDCLKMRSLIDAEIVRLFSAAGKPEATK